jgi:RHS repeat-associated protein
MKTTSLRGRSLALALLATTATCGLTAAPAHAQTAPPPNFTQVDGNGVDLSGGYVSTSLTEGSIGSGEGAVSLERVWAGNAGWTDNWSGRLYRRTSGGVSQMVAEFGGMSDIFTISGTTYTSSKGDGATLVGSGGGYTYTAADGTQVGYITTGPDLGYAISGPGCTFADAGTCGIPTSVTRPSRMVFALNWDIVEKCSQYDAELNCLNGGAFFRFKGVTSTANYSFSTSYRTDTPGNFSAPQTNWYVKTGVTFTNLANTPASLPTVTYSYPSSTGTVLNGLTDTGGRSWGFSYASSGHLSGVRRPGASSNTTSWVYGTGGVTSATVDGIATGYAHSVSGTTATTTVTNALSQSATVVTDLTSGRVTSITDPLSRTTTFTYDSNGRVASATAPEGNKVLYTYDSRGNITETRMRDKAGNSANDIVATASYPLTCSNVVTCNKPTSTTDARGNTTDYSYDGTHGGLLSVTLPAPMPNAVRPQMRYSYSQTNGVYLLTGVSACQTTSSCTGSADEAKSGASYDTSNLVPVSVSSGNGSGTLTATTAAAYDAIGDVLTIDGPLAGSADTTRFRYNAARERIGTISPDPDGSGGMKHRAERVTIDSYDRVSKVERGAVNSQSDSDWAGFSPLEAVETGYDANSRATSQKLTSGSTIYALTQASYDAIGRPECSAQRMNVAAFASLPSSACTLGTQGSDGPDRITKTIYDAAGQVTQVKAAFGTSEASDEITSTYSSNGQLATVTDAEGNKTTYERDGFDRLVKTRFPDMTKGAGTSSTTDYEQLTLDTGGNVTSRRLRDGTSIGLSYDALGRLAGKDLPGTEPDVTFAYDAMSRMISASQTGNSLGFTFDALGRNLTQIGPQGTVTSTYDIAGRRTRIAHPDGFYVDQDYLVTGEMTGIRENGATSGAGVLATYAYDDLGRRTSLTRGDGSVQSYTFDNVSRLTQLADNLAGTTYDQTLGFSYNVVSQIASTTRSNDSYAWSGHGAGSTNYSANGLNQLASVGSTTPTYDMKGNMTSDGTKTFGYSSENLLTSSTGGVGLTYDPARRLYQVAGASSTQFGYDGADLVAEYDSSSSVLRRYVHGPGTDEPLVWYEGSTTTDRRFLHADERGSIAAVTSSSGTAIGVNAYDENGKPAAGNIGRFQYTGQKFIVDLGLYDYKMRMYHPVLSRFAQADPIGYSDGMNRYAYVVADPVNAVDPSGLCYWENWTMYVFDAAGHNLGPDPVHPEHWSEPVGCDVILTSQPRAYDGGGAGGPAEEPPIVVKGTRCVGARFANFFANNGLSASFIAFQRKADPTLLLGLAALESRWGESPKAVQQNNPFGATPHGDATRGLTYPSLRDAWISWDRDWGARISGVGSNANAFVANLRQDNRGVPNAADNRGSYNSENPNWASAVKDTIKSVQSRWGQWLVSGC